MKPITILLGAILALGSTQIVYAAPVSPGQGGTGCPSPVTVADLASYARAGALCQVNDGVDSSDCSAGAGSTTTLCCYDGSSWIACGGGGAGGSGDITAVGDCATGDCFEGTTGNALQFEGATANGYETTLTAADPDADYTVTIPAETGTICTTGSVCTGYSADTHTHPPDMTDVGDCTGPACFSGEDGNTLYFEGATPDDYETALTAADPDADYTLTLPAETGTICSSVSTTSGCGHVSGAATTTDRAVATWNGTGGTTLRNTQCTMATTDGDAGSLGDRMTCPGGFIAEDRNDWVSPNSNLLQLAGNHVDLTNNPTCANDGESGYITIIDEDESGTLDPALCSGTTEAGKFLGLHSVPFMAGGLTVDGAQCAAPASGAIASGPIVYSVTCQDNAASAFYGNVTMPDSYSGGTVTFELEAVAVHATPTNTIDFDFACGCVSDGDAIAAAATIFGGTAQNAAITFATQNVEEHATTAAVTCAGTCAAGDSLYWRALMDATATVDGGGATAADVRILGVKMEYPTAKISDD